jgi:ribonuclease HI
MINIYTDGACSGNKRGCGIGGYGYVIIDGSTRKIYKNGGVILDTTNNIMELVSVIAALKELSKVLDHKTEDVVCKIHSDSKYVVENWNESLIKWLDKGWLTSKGSPVLNKKYWELLFHVTCNYKMVRFAWVKGHDENKYNEMANDIAVSLSQKKRREIEKLKLQEKS